MDPLWNGTIENRYKKFQFMLESKGFLYLDVGGCRHTFQRNNIVIKVPHREAGVIDNIVEAAVWRKYKNGKTPEGIRLAPCRLLPNNSLMMVYVELDIDYRKLPSWAKSVDCEQVGMYNGCYVAYDYALDVDVPDEIAEKYKEVLTANDYF
jgi:hypothetical protein